MNFEVLKRSRVKRNIIIALLVIALISSLMLNFTQAKYRTTESIPLIQGTINFSPSDLNIVAMYLNQDGAIPAGETDIAPKFGYTLNEEQSFCEVNDEKIDNAAFTYESGLLGFYNLNRKGTKCSLYFDLIPDSEKPTLSISTSGTDNSIIVKANTTDNIGIYYYYFQLDNEEEIRTEENSYTFEGLEKDSVHTITVRVEDAAGNVASTSKEVTVGLKSGGFILASENAPTGQTNDWTNQTTYYYTGNPNNWVQFAGFWWRIIRINKDGSIRMIYQGVADSANPDNGNIKGTETQIGTGAFNSSENNKTYVGLVYDGSTQHGYGTNSTIMNTLNSWYNSNIENENKNLHYEQYIDTGVGFCSDRSMSNGDNYTDGSFNYASYDRRNGPASLQCNSEDVLSQDNGKLPNPIGLLTSDEYVFAGSGNSYLYTEQTYWTISPAGFNYSRAEVFIVNVYHNHNAMSVNSPWGIRPVINLRSDVQITGSGTVSDPFKVVGAS